MAWSGRKSRFTVGVASVLVAGAVMQVQTAPTPPARTVGPAPASLAASSGSWTVYHGNSLGSGTDASGVTFSPPTSAWPPLALDGELYGEPLESGGRIFVATENDTIYAVAADSGAILWAKNVGTPVPSGDLPCGNISGTVGITGTPVVDEARGEIFAVADELIGGLISHHLVGLDVFTGHLLLNESVDPPGSTPKALLQRTGLNLSDGHVVFGFGGNAGDCPPYHGWIVSAPEGGGSATDYEIDPSYSEGAVWMGGAAPEVDSSGNIWFATGNGSNTSGPNPDGSDSVTEVSPQLAYEQSFTPSTWASDNGGDADLGSSAPALISNGTVLQIGKSHTAYRLSQSNLGGVGGQLSSIPACSGDVDGGDAVSGTVVYVPCPSGMQEIQTSPSLSVSKTATNGATGPPILAGGLVWSIGGSTLYGMDPSTLATVENVSVGGEANHFPTPSVGDGLLLAPSTDHLYAFKGSAGLPGPPAPPPPQPPNSSYWLAASDGGVFSFGDAQFHGSEGGKPLNAPVVGIASTPDRGGYWLVASDGGVFSFGNARFYGSEGGKHLNAPVVGIAPTPSGRGYWLVASDGGVFSFGDAQFHGSEGAKRLNAPVVGMAASDSGGYWLVARDGGVFSFNATFYGSEGGKHLNAPVVGMAASPSHAGYWLVASDGGIFSFAAPFEGSRGSKPLSAPVVGMASTPSGSGYWLVASDGGVFSFGDANFGGSQAATPLNKPVVGMASAS